MIGYLIIAAIGAIFAYIFIRTAALALSSKVLMRSETFQSYVEEGKDALIALLKNPEGEKEPIGDLLIWNRTYPELHVNLYRQNKLYYTTPDFQSGYDGLEAVYIFEINAPYGQETVHLYPCYTKQFSMQLSMMSMAASGMLFVFFVLFMCHYKFKYLMRISQILEQMEGGNLKKRIPLEGEDELTQVARHINVLAGRIEQDMEEEKRLRAQNMQMISSLSHDIRTPLTAVMSYLDFLEKGAYSSSSQMEAYIHIASQKARQMKEVTDTLFTYTSEDKGPVHKKAQCFEAHTLAEQMLLEIDDWLDGCGFTMMYENTMPKGDRLSVDIVLLRRILDNFCSNIEKYADAIKPVQVMIKKENQKFVLSMSNAIRVKARETESYGIGLKNCKELIESYNGTCKIWQEEGQFQVVMTLPLQNSLE